jgi:hypothetical protein
VQNKMSQAFTNLEAYLRSVLGRLNRKEGLLVSDSFNMESMNNLWQSLRLQMDAHGYRDAVLEQLTGLEQLHYEIQQEASKLGLPEQFSHKSQQAISILIQGADAELTQVANQAAEQMSQIIRRAALGGVDFSDMLLDIQKQLNIHRAQAQTLITTTLHSFNSHMMVQHAKEAGVKWYAYLGPNEQRGSTIWQPDHVIRQWCWQWEGFRGTLEMFEATAHMWGRENHPSGIAAWRGGWRCRHLLNPLMGKDLLEWPIGPRDAVVRARIMSELRIAA